MSHLLLTLVFFKYTQISTESYLSLLAYICWCKTEFCRNTLGLTDYLCKYIVTQGGQKLILTVSKKIEKNDFTKLKDIFKFLFYKTLNDEVSWSKDTSMMNNPQLYYCPCFLQIHQDSLHQTLIFDLPKLQHTNEKLVFTLNRGVF